MGLPEHRLVLFTGSRDWQDREAISAIMLSLDPRRDLLIHGGARGLDERVSWVNTNMGMGFHIWRMPAPWRQHPKTAGPLRNEIMARLLPDYTYAFPLPDSRGTWDMVRRVQARGLSGQVWTPDGWEKW